MLIATFHYYSPFHFTHQGPSGSRVARLERRDLDRNACSIDALKRDFEKASKWSTANNRPVYLGEFGPIRRRYGLASNLDHAVAARRAARFSFAYWEFASGFGRTTRTRAMASALEECPGPG